MNHKIYNKTKRHQVANVVRKNNARCTTIFDIKLYYRSQITKHCGNDTNTYTYTDGM